MRFLDFFGILYQLRLWSKVAIWSMPDRDRGRCLIWLTGFLCHLAPCLPDLMDNGHLPAEDSNFLAKTGLDKQQGN